MKDFNDFLNWDVKIAVKYLVPVTASAFPYPNMITLFTLILAVAGVLVMPNYLMAGVTLFFLGRFLDNVDGERGPDQLPGDRRFGLDNHARVIVLDSPLHQQIDLL